MYKEYISDEAIAAYKRYENKKEYTLVLHADLNPTKTRPKHIVGNKSRRREVVTLPNYIFEGIRAWMPSVKAVTMWLGTLAMRLTITERIRFFKVSGIL